MREGDTPVASRVDRLARSLKDPQAIAHKFKAKGAALQRTEQPVGMGSAAGRAFLGVRRVIATFEANLRRERQLEGIAQAYDRRGRDQAAAQGGGARASTVARRLGIGRAPVHRLLGRTVPSA